MRVALYSPLPPERSGIADYSALLLPPLRRRVEVLVAARGKRRGPRGADVSLFHVGNDPDAHGWIVDALRRTPGVVVLHDYVLHHLVAGITLGRRDGHGYLDAMERDAGVVGRLLAHGVLDKRIPPLWETRPADFPLTREILAAATGLIVHSHYVEDRAREAGFGGPIWRIPHPAWPVEGVRPAELEGDPLIGCFGHINASKRIPQLLEAFARVQRAHPGARLLLAGAVSPRFELDRRLDALSPETRAAVLREDYVPEERLNALIARADVCVSLRSPTMGETSGVALRALSLGRPLVVSELGWFAELPEDAASKVPVDAGEVDRLTAALELLATSPERREAMRTAARAHAEREHALEHVADLYAAALEEAAGGPAVREAVLAEVASAAADVGVGADDPLAYARAVPVPVWLGTLVLVSAAIRFQLSRGMVGPWIMVDELIYSELAKSFAASGHFLFRGHPTGTAFGFVYPVLISPAWAVFQSIPHAYAAAKAINCVVMSLAAVPAYLLARRMAGQWLSLLAATLAVAIPSLVYTGTLMTENAFYPLFLLTVWALVRYLERPSALRVAGLLVALFFTFETRTQAIALLPAILVAPALLSLLDRRGLRGLRDHAWLYGIVGGLIAFVVAVQTARGHSPLAVLGVYESAGQQHHAPATVARWFLYHLAEIDLYVGVIPFAALLALSAMAYRLPRQHRAFVAAVLPISVFLLGVVAEFASRPDVARIEERNMFYLAPLFLIALVAWIDLGVPRPVLATGVAAVAAAALPGVIPFSTLINVPAVSDTLSLIPWWWLQDRAISMQEVPTVVVLCSIGAGLLFLLVPRRAALVLPLVVLAYFAFEQHPIETGPHSVRQASLGSLYVGDANPHRDWIDRAVGRDANVLALWSGVTSPFTIWENEFFNRSVGPIYDLNGQLPGGLPERFAHLDRTTGAIVGDDGRPIRARYVLTDVSVALAGKPLAEDGKNGLVLLRVDGPLRSQSVVSGLYLQDTWSGRSVHYTRFSCTGGRLRVILGSDQGLFHANQLVVARVGGRVVGRASVTPAGTTPLEVPLRSSAGRCVVDFTVGRTVVPAAVTHGRNPDTRELGAHFLRFDYLR